MRGNRLREKTAADRLRMLARRRNMVKATGGVLGQVTVVAGPPGAGKTTWVRARAVAGDLIVDVDTLFVAISGLPWYEKPVGLLPFAMAARDAILEHLEGFGHTGAAWIIMTGPRLLERARMRERFDAEIVVLEVSATECLFRIAQDPRRAEDIEDWRPLVERWWRQYEPDPLDTTLRGT